MALLPPSYAGHPYSSDPPSAAADPPPHVAVSNPPHTADADSDAAAPLLPAASSPPSTESITIYKT